MLVSALIVPIVALVFIAFIKSSSSENETVLEFVVLNQKQLKIYSVGVLFLIVIFGGLIMVAAAIWGVLINAFLFVTALVKKRG